MEKAPREPLPYQDYPASRPGPLTFVCIAGLICLYFAVGYGDAIEEFLGVHWW